MIAKIMSEVSHSITGMLSAKPVAMDDKASNSDFGSMLLSSDERGNSAREGFGFTVPVIEAEGETPGFVNVSANSVLTAADSQPKSTSKMVQAISGQLTSSQITMPKFADKSPNLSVHDGATAVQFLSSITAETQDLPSGTIVEGGDVKEDNYVSLRLTTDAGIDLKKYSSGFLAGRTHKDTVLNEIKVQPDYGTVNQDCQPAISTLKGDIVTKDIALDNPVLTSKNGAEIGQYTELVSNESVLPPFSKTTATENTPDRDTKLGDKIIAAAKLEQSVDASTVRAAVAGDGTAGARPSLARPNLQNHATDADWVNLSVQNGFGILSADELAILDGKFQLDQDAANMPVLVQPAFNGKTGQPDAKPLNIKTAETKTDIDIGKVICDSPDKLTKKDAAAQSGRQGTIHDKIMLPPAQKLNEGAISSISEKMASLSPREFNGVYQPIAENPVPRSVPSAQIATTIVPIAERENILPRNDKTVKFDKKNSDSNYQPKTPRIAEELQFPVDNQRHKQVQKPDQAPIANNLQTNGDQTETPTKKANAIRRNFSRPVSQSDLEHFLEQKVAAGNSPPQVADEPLQKLGQLAPAATTIARLAESGYPVPLSSNPAKLMPKPESLRQLDRQQPAEFEFDRDTLGTGERKISSYVPKLKPDNFNLSALDGEAATKVASSDLNVPPLINPSVNTARSEAVQRAPIFDLYAPQAGERLAREITELSVRGDTKKFEINPRNLGRLEVSLVMRGNSEIIEIKTETNSARDVIAQQGQAIQEMLKAQGRTDILVRVEMKESTLSASTSDSSHLMQHENSDTQNEQSKSSRGRAHSGSISAPTEAKQAADNSRYA